MKRIIKIVLLLNAFTLTITLSTISQSNRFVERVFDEIHITEGIYFSNGLTYLNNNKELFFDLYEPANDTMSYRPLVITIFGGAFIAGNRQWVDMRAYGDSLSRYGYVVASIDYRTGYNPLSQSSMVRAVYRACQDVNAAIRFFKANYNIYKIDTTQIFLLGNSAGTIAALSSIYLEEEERPIETFSGAFQSDLGCINCTGDYQNHTKDVTGVVAQWGGISNLTLIDEFNDTPVCFIHGTNDNSIPYTYGPAYNTALFPNLHGSYNMSLRLDTLGIEHELHTFENASHCFYLEQDNMTFIPDSFKMCLNITLNFLNNHNNYIDLFTSSFDLKNNEKVFLYPNPVNNILNIKLLHDNNEKFKIIVKNILGFIIFEKIISTDNYSIDVSNLGKGIYFMEWINEKEKGIEKFMVY